MGGRSYYALDLTDIDNPHLKFHIDPASGMVYSKENPKGKSFPEIKNMGQSWSKPKLDYVNWKVNAN
jgi:type IV pilus assembly protein PilY1